MTFRIENDREYFFQWDLNQRLIIDDNTINEVHFCNKTEEYSLVCEVYEEDGKRLVNVPNILLQDNWDIHVYAYCESYTKVEKRYKVIQRSKPADYIYTETEIKNYDDLKARVDEIEKNGVSQEAVNAAVSAYLTENPIEAGATVEEAAQIEQNRLDIIELKNKEVDYALKSEIPTVPTNVSEFVNDAGYLTEHQSLTNYYTKAEVDTNVSKYALKSEIPSIEGLATETYVNNAVNNAKVDLSGYALKTDIPTNVSAFTNDADYATKVYVDNAIGSGGAVDLSNYYTKAEVDSKIPDVSGYQTEEQVLALIQANIPASGDEVSY